MPYGQQPRFLFRDNDGIYGGGVREFLDSCGIEHKLVFLSKLRPRRHLLQAIMRPP